jgi:hypothetical protein
MIILLLVTMTLANPIWFKIRATVRRHIYDSMRVLNSYNYKTEVPMFLKVDENLATVSHFMYLTPQDAEELGILYQPILFSENRNLGVYQTDFELIYTNSFLTTLCMPIDIEKGTGFIYHLSKIDTSLIESKDKKYIGFQKRQGIKEIYYFEDVQSSVGNKISGLRNAKINSLLQNLANESDINKLHELVTLLHLTNNNLLVDKLKNIRDEINVITKDAVNSFNFDFKFPNDYLLDISNDAFQGIYKNNNKRAFNEQINNLANKLIDELSKIAFNEIAENYYRKYEGLLKFFAKYLHHKHFNFDNPINSQKALASLANVVYNAQVDYLSYNRKGYIDCDKKIDFFKELEQTSNSGSNSKSQLNNQTLPIKDVEFSSLIPAFEELINTKLDAIIKEFQKMDILDLTNNSDLTNDSDLASASTNLMNGKKMVLTTPGLSYYIPDTVIGTIEICEYFKEKNNSKGGKSRKRQQLSHGIKEDMEFFGYENNRQNFIE